MNRPKPWQQRFPKYVSVAGPDECWNWTGSIGNHGYGELVILSAWKERKRNKGLAHRLAWELANGPIPEGMFVCHSCDNRRCVNPAHLWLGTPADNSRDMANKGRSYHGERHHRSRITAAEAAAIKEAAGTHESIAKQYGVGRTTVTRIKNGTRWRHVEK